MSFASAESRWSDVYLVAGARAVSVCGDFLAATTLTLVLHDAGYGGSAVSGLMLAATLPPALLGPIAGRIADRVDSRTVLVTTGLVQAGVCLLLAYAREPVLIIALVAVLACGLAVTQPTQAALVPELVRREDLAKASGLTQTAGAIGMLLAPALAGLLVGQAGARLPLLLDAASYLAVVVAGLALHTRRRPGVAAEAAPAFPWRLRDDPALTLMAGVLAAVVLGINAVNVVEVFFIRDTLAASTTMFGVVAASWTAGMLIGGVVFSRVPDRRITMPLLLAVTAASCVVLLGSAAVGSAAWLIPLWLVGGAGNGGTNVFLMVLVAGRTPAAARGRAYAAVGAAVQGAGLLGLLAAGPLVQRFEPRWLMAASGAAGLLAVVTCMPLVRRESSSPPAVGEPAAVRDSVGA